MAMIVALSGGFRGHIGTLRVGVTSPYPLLAWALAAGIVRHLVAPHESVYRELRGLAGLLRSPAARAAAATVVGTQPVMLVVGYLAVFMFGYVGGRAPLRYFDNELLNLPVRWDAGWYLQIVTEGYRYTPDDPERQQNIVFFPAYPTLLRGVGRLLGGHMTGYILAGTMISLLAFFGALIYLYLFTRDSIGDDKARCALWLTASYPFAFFFGAIYTESLFLLGAIGAFYHFTRQQFGRAALWGLLVGLTRLNGCLLSIPIALLAIFRWQPGAAGGAGGPPGIRDLNEVKEVNQGTAKVLAAVAMPALGLLLYAAFIWRLTGDPTLFAAGHAAWGRKPQGLTALVAQQFSIIAGGGLSGYVATPGYDVLNAIGALFALATAWPVARRVGSAYAVFMLINIVPPLAAGGLLSAGRFSAVLFPAFIWLADAVPPAHRAGLVATFAAGQAYNAALYYTWRPLF
jgi:hypothetical protein